MNYKNIILSFTIFCFGTLHGPIFKNSVELARELTFSDVISSVNGNTVSLKQDRHDPKVEAFIYIIYDVFDRLHSICRSNVNDRRNIAYVAPKTYYKAPYRSRVHFLKSLFEDINQQSKFLDFESVLFLFRQKPETMFNFIFQLSQDELGYFLELRTALQAIIKPDDLKELKKISDSWDRLFKSEHEIHSEWSIDFDKCNLFKNGVPIIFNGNIIKYISKNIHMFLPCELSEIVRMLFYGLFSWKANQYIKLTQAKSDDIRRIFNHARKIPGFFAAIEDIISEQEEKYRLQGKDDPAQALQLEIIEFNKFIGRLDEEDYVNDYLRNAWAEHKPEDDEYISEPECMDRESFIGTDMMSEFNRRLWSQSSEMDEFEVRSEISGSFIGTCTTVPESNRRFFPEADDYPEAGDYHYGRVINPDIDPDSFAFEDDISVTSFVRTDDGY